MGKPLVCVDCGKCGKSSGVETRLYGRFADIPLCSDCRESRLDRIWQAARTTARCCKCGSPDVETVLGPPESNSWYCAACDARAVDNATRNRERQLAAGGLNIDPTAY